MDPLSIATAAAVVLRPLLQYLGDRGGDVASGVEEAATEGASRATLEWAGRVWQRLRGGAVEQSFDQEQALVEAAGELVEHQEDPDVEAAFRLRIRRIIEADPELAEDIRNLLASPPQGTTILGERAVNVGTVTNSAIVTGNDNTVGDPRERR